MMQSFQFNPLLMSILHIIMNYRVGVLITCIRYQIFYRAFNMTLDFQVSSIWAIFSMDFVIEYFTFQIYVVKFPVILSMDEHPTHNNEKFGGSLIKIKQLLSILQGF